MPHGRTSNDTPIPDGICQCGECGLPTSTISKTIRSQNRIKGEPSRYRPGHNHRKILRYQEVETTYGTCWIWRLAKSYTGYPIEWDPSGKTVRAHRRYYEAKHGPIPDGLDLDHLCRTRACVNPDHLEAVPRAENIRRGSKTKLTAEIVREIRTSNEKHQVLAKRHGISQGHVSRIKRGLAWRDIEPADKPSLPLAA